MAREVLAEALERLRRGERIGLATVVDTRGSTPQKAGARVLTDVAGQRLAGTLGGGAVEAAALSDAAESVASGTTLLREYQLAAGVDDWGLACGGTMVVLTEPLSPTATAWLETAAGARDEREPVAVVTILPAGRRLIVRGDEITGPVEDAPLREAAAALAREALRRERAGIGEAGDRRLYVEVFGPAHQLVIAGAGHVGRALATLGRFLGLRVVVIDDRPEYASRERFPDADEVWSGPVGELVARAAAHVRTAVVVTMRNQDLDYEATAAALRSPARYVGLLGARRKAATITARLTAEGMEQGRVGELRAPVGLDLGARTPEEIALSVLGEWLALREGAGAAPLREPGRAVTGGAGEPAGGGRGRPLRAPGS